MVAFVCLPVCLLFESPAMNNLTQVITLEFQAAGAV